ncbi:hypothetical protein [Ancylobacter oerskovii]|uniref:TIGR02449 family protein n=1 Tax=Ancylobacter oerskovii TaxID=459519 RepID=A0ABW4Z2X9_9HYPH|nr:hypothetical protein [Ancylobacter oerskovii]MBS7544863.1 hypothetical protein [Ancylobacter oerskovii]
MQTINELLADFETALDVQAVALAKARRQAVTAEERLQLVRASRRSWERMQAVRRELDRLAGQ